MRVMVKFLLFLPGNHQGGEGIWDEIEKMIVINDMVLACDVWDAVLEELVEQVKKEVHWWTDSKIIIKTIKIVE